MLMAAELAAGPLPRENKPPCPSASPAMSSGSFSTAWTATRLSGRESIKSALASLDLTQVIPTGTANDPELRLSISVGIGSFRARFIRRRTHRRGERIAPESPQPGRKQLVFPEDVA
jgi:hypothetical protein